MDTQKLRAVIAAVECKSLSKAAERFGYTPSAMTHITNSVENELGVKILKRTHSGVVLTEEGVSLYPELVSFIALEDKILKSAESISTDRYNSLTIGSFASISLYVLPELLKKFKRRYPDIKISVTVQSSFTEPSYDNDFDIIFSELSPLSSDDARPFMRDRFAVLAAEDVFSGRVSVTREELYPHTFIMTNDRIMNTYFDLSRFNEIVKFTSADDMSVISMVREGMGIAVLPSLSVRRVEKGVRVLELLPEVYRTLTYTPNNSRDPSRALRLFMSFLNDEMGSAL